MEIKISEIIIFLLYFSHSLGFQVIYQNFKSNNFKIKPTTRQNLGSPLFLTPLLESGKIAEAREQARVQHREMKNVKSYSGYLTVNKHYNSNMFFWYFTSKGNASTDPLILWLQGGPGVTSLYGLFSSTGPFVVTEEDTLEMRNITWIENHNILYIDSPVGTGFSFTEDDLGYATSINDVAQNLYIALRQFFVLFPGLRKNQLYVMGESYAGKYVPALSYVIHKANANSNLKNHINLVGLAIGNGWTDPTSQCQYSNFLYEIGLIDQSGREQSKYYETQIIDLIKQEKFTEAFYVNNLLLGSDGYGNPGLFVNLTGYTNYYNYMQFRSAKTLFPFTNWLQQPSVLRSIHVGNREFNPLSYKVYGFMINDFMRSTAAVVSALLENYRVLIYTGQLDIICAYPLIENYLEKLNWSGAAEYKRAEKKQLWIENELAGYKKSAKHLTEVMIRNAGHMVPNDQPLWAWTLISHFTRNKLR